jgi:hypothetical protein
MNVILHALAAILLLEAPVSSQTVDIGRWEEDTGERNALRFKAGDVVLIEVKTGQRAVVQFTPVGDTHARYRWRYRASPDSQVITGTGEVEERYGRSPEGTTTDLRALPGHDTTVQLGDIRTEWSAGGGGEGYLYYFPGRAQLKILPSTDFALQP